MYIYDHGLFNAQSQSKAPPIISRPGQLISYCPDRVVRGYLGRGESGGPYVWAREGVGQATPEDEANKLMKQLQPLFLKNFSKNRITYGTKVGQSVRFRVVTDTDFKAEV